jgi:hypothetical protein
VTVITPGSGCSIISTTTVSIAGALISFVAYALFAPFVPLPLALPSARFARFLFASEETFRAFLPAVDFRIARFVRCVFAFVFRLTMIDPPQYDAPVCDLKFNVVYQGSRRRALQIFPRPDRRKRRADSDANPPARLWR